MLLNDIKNTAALQQMLKIASERIIAWYNNVAGFKAVIEEFVSKQDYETAYALLASVPKEASCMFGLCDLTSSQSP
jgi:hypothetical protein